MSMDLIPLSTVIYFGEINHNAKIDCTGKQITFEKAEGKEAKLEGEKVVSPPCFISVAKA